MIHMQVCVMSAAFDRFEYEVPFCAMESCPLHVRPGDPGVEGQGNWVKHSSGLTIGRRVVDGRYLCDPCAMGLSLPSAGD